MKKQITKHFMAFFLSLVMIMAMGLTAFAADTPKYSLTVENTGNTEHIFELYQIFTGDLSEGTLSNIQWGAGVTDAGKKQFGDASTKAASLKKEDDAKDFANSLAQYLTLPTTSTGVSANSSYKFDNLTAGYYLVKDKDGTQNNGGSYTSFIMEVTGDEIAHTKLGVPTVEKKVQDTNDSTDETSNWQDSADYDINDWVPYQITGTMPSNIDRYSTYKYVFTDTMSTGLTYDGKDLDHKAKIYIGEKNVTGSFEEDVTTNNDGSTTVTWTCGNLKGIEGVTVNKETKVVVTYSAKLNEHAVIGAAGNPNTVSLTYSNNPNQGGNGDTGKTPEDKNIVFTYKTIVNKLDQDKKSLAGAAFKLEKKQSDGTYKKVTEYTAGEETTFEFTGLDDGEYKLTETTTPAGYNTITPIEFTILAEHDTESADPKLTKLSGNATSGEATFTVDDKLSSLTTDVVNKKGSTLPSTGGRGTTMIYIIGAALVVTAGVVLVMRKKMNSDK